MSELEKYQPPQIAELDKWAVKLYESGTFTDVKSAAQAFVKIAAGAEMGLTPFQAITGVHFIQNKPVIGAGLLAAMLDRAPYNYTVEWEPSIESPTACTITVFKHGVERGKSRFSLDDAKRAGLTGGNWQKYPTDMMFARAVSQAARRYAPGAMGTTFYVEAHGETEIQPEQATPKPRSRVTAEVVPEPVEEVEGEVVMPYALEPVGAQLKAMSKQELADLYRLCGIPKGSKVSDVQAILIAKADELGLAFQEPPDARAVLEAGRLDERESLPDDAADAFQYFADTGQDLADDPQTAIQ